MERHTIRTLLWIAWSLSLAGGQQTPELCGHPPVPAGATYLNVTGGLGQRDWAVRYICDNGKNKYQTTGHASHSTLSVSEHELHTPNKTTTTSELITNAESLDKA